MNSLPTECHGLIFNKLIHKHYSKDLLSCALVNRSWCNMIIPMLWNEPGHHFKDIKLIKTILLMLNTEERDMLNKELLPFKKTIPESKPQLEYRYTNYITSITNDLFKGFKNWLYDEKNGSRRKLVDCSEEGPISCFIALLLRNCIKLKSIYLDDFIVVNEQCRKEFLKNTAITSLDLRLQHNIKDGYKSINGLRQILYNNSNLKSLKLISTKLGVEGMKQLFNALSQNDVVESLSLRSSQIGVEEGEEIAKFLCKNTILISLDVSYNNLETKGGNLLLAALCENDSLKDLNLEKNQLGSEVGKTLAEVLCKNTTLTSLNISKNDLASGGIELADALCKNTSLLSLNINGNILGLEEVKKLAEALCKNTTLVFLDISNNRFGSEGLNMLEICKNTKLTLYSRFIKSHL